MKQFVYFSLGAAAKASAYYTTTPYNSWNWGWETTTAGTTAAGTTAAPYSPNNEPNAAPLDAFDGFQEDSDAYVPEYDSEFWGCQGELMKSNSTQNPHCMKILDNRVYKCARRACSKKDLMNSDYNNIEQAFPPITGQGPHPCYVLLSHKANEYQLSENPHDICAEFEGINDDGRPVHFYYNYSSDKLEFDYPHQGGTELVSKKMVKQGETLAIGPWDVLIIEEL